MARTAVFAACLFATVPGFAGAKPAGVPVDVHDLGRERPGVDHEFYRPDDFAAPLAFALPVGRATPVPPRPKTATELDLPAVAREIFARWIFPLGLAAPSNVD